MDNVTALCLENPILPNISVQQLSVVEDFVVVLIHTVMKKYAYDLFSTAQ